MRMSRSDDDRGHRTDIVKDTASVSGGGNRRFVPACVLRDFLGQFFSRYDFLFQSRRSDDGCERHIGGIATHADAYQSFYRRQLRGIEQVPVVPEIGLEKAMKVGRLEGYRVT